jgi:hypothetical protein
MLQHLKCRHVWTIALLALAGCNSAAQQEPRATEKSKATTPEYGTTQKSAPPKPLSADAAAPTGEPDKKEKEKRGNTPPGTDRSGGGPASGAIVDPAGVTQK